MSAVGNTKCLQRGSADVYQHGSHIYFSRHKMLFLLDNVLATVQVINETLPDKL